MHLSILLSIIKKKKRKNKRLNKFLQFYCHPNLQPKFASLKHMNSYFKITKRKTKRLLVYYKIIT